MKARIKIRILDILLIGLFSMTIWSCTYDIKPTEQVEIPDTVSYSLDIQPIWDESCNSVGCHNAGGINPDLSPANSWNALISGDYVEVGDPLQSLLYQKIAPGGSMAQYATDQDRALVFTWIEEGAKDN